MQMQRPNFYSQVIAWSLLNVCLVLIALHPVVSQNEHLIPDHCEMRKPKSEGNCETLRRWFLHETRGCKAYGICHHQTAELDSVTHGINYFTSKEDCQKSCMQGIVCPQLPLPDHGNITTDGIIGWGGSITYSCDQGYALVGNRDRTCQRTATWSGSAPTCQKQCPPPPPVEDGMIAPVHNYYNQGTSIFYICREGYKSNTTERVCQADGVWSGVAPKCEFQTQLCPEPALMHNGQIFAPDRSIGENVSYICNSGFILIGNDTRTCGSDVQWEGEAPICWKLLLEYFEEDSPDTEEIYITNRTLNLPINTRNVWIRPVSSHPDPFTNVIPVWFFNKEVLQEMQNPHGVEAHEQNLKFLRILESREQEGNYTLKVGSFSVSFHLVVEDEMPTPAASVISPELIVSPSDETKSVGENVRFSCVFTGCPPPNVTWFHNDTVLLPGGRVAVEVYMHHRLTICHLTINNVSETDTGPYMCVGDNVGGNSSSNTVDLQISNPSTVSLRKRAVDSLSLLSAESLLCKQISDPESVTVIVTAKKELRRVRHSHNLRSHRFEINKILRGAVSQSSSNPLNKKSLRAVIMESNDDNTTHLKVNNKYILNGRMANDILYVSGPQYMHQYSAQLENHIQSC